MYNIFFKINEYIMDYIIDVCIQSWGHVWKLRTFQTPTLTTHNNEVLNHLHKYVFAYALFVKRLLYDATHGFEYSSFSFLKYFSTFILYHDDVSTMAYVVDKAFA